MKTNIQLTKNLQVSSGGHILYLYDEIDRYVRNAVSYIVTGSQENHHIFFIDRMERFQLINEELKTRLSKEDLKKVHFIDSYDFYNLNGDFNTSIIVDYFQKIVQPLIESGTPFRTWAHVEWNEQKEIFSRLVEYETSADTAVNDLKIISVCAYSGARITSSIQIKMMSNHEYVMTDDELLQSHLYKKKKVVFPSLSIQAEIQSEMDLYKRKLDFINVISHEVRNPLTVIKAYGSLILSNEQKLSEDGVKKLKSIVDYVDVIDHEITNIIRTEQMLSADELWKLERIDPLTAIDEVLYFMNTKARCENIELVTNISLPNICINSNVIGFNLLLSNLLSNAIKYSYEKKEVYLAAYVKNKDLVITVKDYGIGMAEHQVAKLFYKYEKMNLEKTGQGVGMYTVNLLVKHFQGSIYVKSKVNEGTEIRVEFPLL
ncbi:MEDS domain-containing protein [Jeotgalibacillus soli]|uniref:histidine kinase n=1 Tax=Jeotgalibacillus soli TaxID=889306 RepID=A0A0C2RNI7_9BACL|nr:MEDS domain-containing protein [Jeotgalibacillus soli]KIL51840.1 histidine kinase [Jeotgalibacillus soli]